MKNEIAEALKHRILVLDGAMGTMLQTYGLCEADFRGEIFASSVKELKGNNECLNLTRPDVVRAIHDAYIAAGADIIETNSFSANRISQQEYGCEDAAGSMAYEAARIARAAADAAPRKVWVAGSVGPTGKSLSLASDLSDPSFRAVDFDQMADAYGEQISGLARGGVDLILVETCFDALNVKAAIYAAQKVAPELPMIISVAVSDRSGRTLTGQTIDAFYTSVKHAPLLAFGLNCSFGASELEYLLESVNDVVECPVSFYPNAGLPNEMGQYDQSPDDMAAAVRSIAEKGLVNIVGGCCGTTPEHISALKRILEGVSPRFQRAGRARLVVSGLECAVIDKAESNFTNIGERTNVAGSRKFARLIASGAYDEALQVAADQIEGGASIIDINMDDAMLDSEVEMTKFLRYISNDPAVAKAALMIDSSHFDTIIAGLKNAQGKCIVNSISLKEGEEVFLDHARQLKALGAAVIVMAFDEEGQATTYERKIEICSRAYHLLVDKLGFNSSDVIFDVNVLSVGTGIAEHARYGADFIEAVRWIKTELPGALTSGGISNLSFAFRGNNAVREAMHSAFLFHATAAGLDMGIVNPSMLQVYDDIDPTMLEAVEDVILDRRSDATERLIDKAQEILAAKDNAAAPGAPAAVVAAPSGDAAERLTQALVKGNSSSLKEDVLEVLEKYDGKAVSVIEGPLMAGMEKVGKLFGDGKMFLPQVVKSAKIMRDAVDILEPYMQEDDDSEVKKKPKVVIATVKGDVHDIGKNITAIVLRCNGFDVTDLGVMVPCETILEEAVRLNADIVAASGLITPSLARMEELCIKMREAGMTKPLFIGGATTSALHTAVKLAPLYDHVFYGSDASASAVLAKRYMMDPEEFERTEHEAQQKIRSIYDSRSSADNTPAAVSTEESVCPEFSVKDIPCRILQVDEVMPFFDWKMFYAVWGFKYGSSETPEALALKADALDMIERMRSGDGCVIRIEARFLPSASDGDAIIIDSGSERIALPMLRQEGGERKCLADFLPSVKSGKMGSMGVFAVSVHRRRHLAQCDCERCNAAEYDSMLERSLRLTFAEAASSWLDSVIADQVPQDMKICKPAAGYSSCPDHTLKRDILDLLPGRDELGIRFTDSYAMIPDASICGFVFVHPDACYPDIRNLSAAAVDSYAERRGFSDDERRLFLGHLSMS